MPVKAITYCGKPAALACDGKCHKAWGISQRPKIQFSDNPDDYAFLSDSEVGIAPIDPGTSEGNDGKPLFIDPLLNKWCARECERSAITTLGEPAKGLPNFDQRLHNLGRKRS